MEIKGIVNGKVMTEQVEDFNGLLKILMDGERIYIQGTHSPIQVVKGAERRSIVRVTDNSGNAIYDVSAGIAEKSFCTFLKNAKNALQHPELLLS